MISLASFLLDALTTHSAALIGLGINLTCLLIGVWVGEARASHRQDLSASRAAIAALKPLIEQPSRVLYSGLPMDALDEIEASQWIFRRRRLRQAIARCEKASQQRHQDAVGQGFLDDEHETRRALKALLRLLG